MQKNGNLVWWIITGLMIISLVVGYIAKDSVIHRNFGIWLAAYLTLAIFSFLYADNPLYKLVEYIFMGVSAGYWIAYQFNNVLLPNMIAPIMKGPGDAVGAGAAAWYYAQYIIPGLLGVIMLMRLVPKIGWISRWSLGFIVGVTSGITIYATIQAQIIDQLRATMKALVPSAAHAASAGIQAANAVPLSDVIGNWTLVLGVVCGLFYFYFSKEHTGFFGKMSRVGIWFLMVSFGASFGYTVMARISLLIGRVSFLIFEWIQPTLRAWHFIA